MAIYFGDGTSGGLFWLKWKSGEFKSQRLGQAFCNHFNLSEHERTDHGRAPDLFYEMNKDASLTRLQEILARWQET